MLGVSFVKIIIDQLILGTNHETTDFSRPEI